MNEAPEEIDDELRRLNEKLAQEIKNNPNAKYLDEHYLVFDEARVKNIMFLDAWKKGINKIGTEFFDIKADSVDAATDKSQLQPNLKLIQEAIGGYSHEQQVMLGLMYSFYNPEDGQKLLEKSNTANFVDALNVLDGLGRSIISQLWLTHSDW